ncbi:acetate kinase [Dyella choica]|uniref:Acetate kinase n=1 Tax=Dyella choica TaxID=1927959 RepID=A0A3S0RHF9_9GAMM|nr:acetate kinase [Dyella choica]RUL69532.1 acetate kinase [Dyella choica]
MKKTDRNTHHATRPWLYAAGCAGFMAFSGAVTAQDASHAATDDGSSPVIRQRLAEQSERIEVMRGQIEALQRQLAQQEADYRALRHAVGMDVLDRQRGGNIAAGGGTATALPMPSSETSTDVQVAQQGATTPGAPVGQAPAENSRPPEVAPIFQQPGVLTPKGKVVLEPTYQFGYSTANRVALVGYTIIPAILIGLIDVRQVRSTTQTAILTGRYGITNRMELEVRVPYVDTHTDTVSREVLTGSAEDNVFGSSGKGLGDIEATLRYQLNDGGADKPYYIGWFRFKSRTGKDPFEVTTDCVTRCVQNLTGTGLPIRQPTGSGFYSLQPGLTWLFPSDPVVFFGNFSYLYNVERHNVYEHILLGGRQFLGNVKMGNEADISVGMGMALNDKASLSIGYDQTFIGTTSESGRKLPGSTKVWLGSLLIGGSYRFSDKRTLNVTLGVGVTRDTPDATVIVRVPMTF